MDFHRLTLRARPPFAEPCSQKLISDKANLVLPSTPLREQCERSRRLDGLIVVCLPLVLWTAGCATTRTTTPFQELHSRVDDMEKRVAEEGEDIEALKTDLRQLGQEIKRVPLAPSPQTSSGPQNVSTRTSEELIRVAASGKDIQKALKNAGYYKGPIDGKLGEKTKTAIKAFQQANGLNADGVVGEKTWSKLKTNLL